MCLVRWKIEIKLWNWMSSCIGILSITFFAPILWVLFCADIWILFFTQTQKTCLCDSVNIELTVCRWYGKKYIVNKILIKGGITIKYIFWQIRICGAVHAPNITPVQTNCVSLSRLRLIVSTGLTILYRLGLSAVAVIIQIADTRYIINSCLRVRSLSITVAANIAGEKMVFDLFCLCVCVCACAGAFIYTVIIIYPVCCYY